jgi:hypothetical protein
VRSQGLSYTREAYSKKLQRIKGLGNTVNDNMTYNGGLVHTNLDVVLIFLGAWSSAKAKQTAALLTYFAANANSTLWLKTGRRYLPDPHLQPEGALNNGVVRLRVRCWGGACWGGLLGGPAGGACWGGLLGGGAGR